MKKDKFYSETIDSFYRGKDSIIEMGKIVSYDKERLVARVYTLTSKQYLEDIPVMFPAMHFNTGMISPPVKNSTGMILWGADRQPFLLPVQYIIPSQSVKDGVNTTNASPAVFDDLLTLRNVESGEHLMRSLGGAYVFARNNGEIEFGTPHLHICRITPDGTLELIVDRIKTEIGNSWFYFGPTSVEGTEDDRTRIAFEFDESTDETKQLPNLNDKEFLEAIMNDRDEEIELEPTPKLLRYQMGHVYNEMGDIQIDNEDGSELLSKSVLEKDDHTRIVTVSKSGRKVVHTSKPGIETEVITSASELDMIQRRVVDGEVETTHIGINEDGNIFCTKNEKSFDLFPMLEWFYEQRGES